MSSLSFISTIRLASIENCQPCLASLMSCCVVSCRLHSVSAHSCLPFYPSTPKWQRHGEKVEWSVLVVAVSAMWLIKCSPYWTSSLTWKPGPLYRNSTPFIVIMYGGCIRWDRKPRWWNSSSIAEQQLFPLHCALWTIHIQAIHNLGFNVICLLIHVCYVYLCLLYMYINWKLLLCKPHMICTMQCY